MLKFNIKNLLRLRPSPSRVIDVTVNLIISLSVTATLLYSSRNAFFRPFIAVDDTPSADELEAGADELPEGLRDLIYEGEYPLGLGIYDIIFSDDNIIAPDGELKIVDTDLSKNPMPTDIYYKNNTSYKIDVDKLLTAEGFDIGVSSDLPKSQPLVLIYHTHGTEGYAEEGKLSYSPSALPRSTDITENVVAVGKRLAEILNENGIPTLHCEIMHDNGSYNTAYKKSADTVKEYLKKYPSIKYCFDIHRDALCSETTVYKTVTYDESTPIAQLMFVVGTDSAGADHDTWQRNLSFAVNAQHFLISRLNNIVRPISIKKSAYNQQYPYVGSLIEVGTCANTLKEALNATEILGDILSGMILSDLPLYDDKE